MDIGRELAQLKKKIKKIWSRHQQETQTFLKWNCSKVNLHSTLTFISSIFCILTLPNRFQFRQDNKYYLVFLKSTWFLYLQQLFLVLNQKMKITFPHLSVALLLAALFCFAYSDSTPVTIISVSTNVAIYVPAVGSIAGGTTIYISGTGFGTSPTLINILVGPYPCNLTMEGVTDSGVTCITTPLSIANKGSYLPVQVQVFGKPQSVCNTPSMCLFSYTAGSTPTVNQIVTRTAVGNQIISIAGYHVITNIGDGRSPDNTDVNYILIGNTVCSLLDIVQVNLNPNNYGVILCAISPIQSAGEYFLTENTKVGTAVMSYQMPIYSFITTATYHERVVAAVNFTLGSEFSHSGSMLGARLKLPGTGFTTNLSDYKCNYGGQNCFVIDALPNLITVEIPPMLSGSTLGKLPQDPLDNTTQQLSFLGGPGFNATRYKFAASMSLGPGANTLADLLHSSSNNLPVIDSRIVTQLGSQVAPNVVQWTRGYFWAPTSGIYTFFAGTSNNLLVQMAPLPSNANASLMILFQLNSATGDLLNPFLNKNPTLTSVNLTKPGYYYFEIIAMGPASQKGMNTYTFWLATPPLSKPVPNPTPRFDVINIKAIDYQPEVFNITVNISALALANTTTFTLYQYFVSGGVATLETSLPLYPGILPDNFYFNFFRIPDLQAYGPTVVGYGYDSNGVLTTNKKLWATYVLVLSLTNSRPSSAPASFLANPASAVTVAKVQQHSMKLGGSYKMLYNGVAIQIGGSPNIPAQTQFSQIQSALNSFFKVGSIVVKRSAGIKANDLINLFIEYRGIEEPGALTFDTTLLTGGANNTFNVSVSTPLPYDAYSPYYAAVPFDFLNLASPNPNIQLTEHQMPIVCPNCIFNYDINLTPNLTSATLTQLTLSLSISLPTGVSPPLSSITVWMLGVQCILMTGTPSNFNCKFAGNSMNGAALPAGTDVPVVFVSQLGKADSSQVTPISVPISVTSFAPSASSPSGGLAAALLGFGFPTSPSTPPKLAVLLCGTAITHFTLISNQRIQFIVPPQSNFIDPCVNTVTVNGKSASFAFNYDPNLMSTVTGLSITTASPILKQSLTVTGTQFGTVPDTKVFLYNQTGVNPVYQLTVTKVTATTIECLLEGGRTGTYQVRVTISNVGTTPISQSTVFKYEVVVNSIQPAQGSLGGGYPLTINGRGFAAISSMNVFVGNAENTFCTITFCNATQIVCTVPPMPSVYSSSTPQLILVTARITDSSSCQGNCYFTYLQNLTTQLAPLSSNILNAGVNVTIIARMGDISRATVRVGAALVSTVMIINSTAIQFAFPALINGVYKMVISTASGDAVPQFTVSTPVTIVCASGSSSYGGNQVTAVGNGLSSNTSDPTAKIYMICNSVRTQLVRISASPIATTFYTPPLITRVDTICQLEFHQPNMSTVYSYHKYLSASTQSVNITQMTPLTYTIVKNNLTAINILSVTAFYLNYAGQSTLQSYPFTLIIINSTTATISIALLPAGSFRIAVFTTKGYAVSPQTLIFTIAMSVPTLTPAVSSYAGGANITISGTGFHTTDPSANKINICGISAPILSVNQSGLTLTIPALLTATTQTTYNLNFYDTTLYVTLVADKLADAAKAFDNDTTTVYNSDNTICYVGMDAGAGLGFSLSKIGWIGSSLWTNVPAKMVGAVFETSDDGVSWSILSTVNAPQAHSGWNFWSNPNRNGNSYRFVRFRHSNKSQCQLAEIQFTGQIYSAVTVRAHSDTPCPLTIAISNNPVIQIPAAVTYQDSLTCVIDSIIPPFGPSIGGTKLTLMGLNFGTMLSLVIDGVPCNISSISSTTVTCSTGTRATSPSGGNTFVVMSDGNIVSLKQGVSPFIYMDRWSSQATWGGQALPRDGDTVYVPQGMSLFVDMSTPILQTIAVEGGKVIFADEMDMKISASYIIMKGGEFRAGLQSAPYKNKLEFTLYGNPKDKQLPLLGNKVIGCLNCLFNMHGLPRTPTWTDLASTVNPGDITLTLTVAVDWQSGESIVVASSSFDHYESQEKVIASVSLDKMTLTVTTPFRNRHFAAIQNYDGRVLAMRAEVGLLTRNVLVQGDSDSSNLNYGSHMIFTGRVSDGLSAKLSYTEFTKCGQPGLMGRYCTHFHMVGEVFDSFVRGVSVHWSYARFLTIHATFNLLVELNVGYHIQGHNIFLEDGIETGNVIQDNLMITSISSPIMLQSDLTVASYWITHPSNTLINNRAAGGDFYGFWYQIKTHPDGPSATGDICPPGMPLGPSHSNTAHSNVRFGLRIFQLYARTYPCALNQNESMVNPFESNPSIQSVFDNYTLWKNAQCGFLGQQLGNTIINNFKVADSKKAGLQFHLTSFSKELVVAQNSLVVGFSQGNSLDLKTYGPSRGVIAPRTNGLLFDSISFVNFASTMVIAQSCSECFNFRVWVTGGKITFFKNITYTNMLGSYVIWFNWKRQVFIDLDGSFTAPFQKLIPSLPAQASASVTNYRVSLEDSSHCYNTFMLWDSSIYCDATVSMRTILFTNPQPLSQFSSVDIRVAELSDSLENVTGLPLSHFSSEPMINILSGDTPNSWAQPFSTNKYYHVHWFYSLDFLAITIVPNQNFNSSDGLVLRFNYTATQSSFNVTRFYGSTMLPMTAPSSAMIFPNTCNDGDNYQDLVNKYLFVCVSGRNKSLREAIQVNANTCLSNCSSVLPPSLTTQEIFTRLWSNASQWPNAALPAAGSSVVVLSEWNLMLDISPPGLAQLVVFGSMTIDPSKNITLTAKVIWVYGSLSAGTPTNRYLNFFKIVLTGNTLDPTFSVDKTLTGTKALFVTGSLSLYGALITNAWTRLTVIAYPGTTQITVINAKGWQIGNEVAIGSSYSRTNEDEQVRITGISGNIVSFTPALVYEHYGAQEITVTHPYGCLDTRSAVGLLTKNIQIVRDEDPFGCQVVVYTYLEVPANIINPAIVHQASANLSGVEIANCSVGNSFNAALNFLNIGSLGTNNQSNVEYSSVHGCSGVCTYVDKAKKLSFNNNVFYSGVKYLVNVLNVQSSYTFTMNLLLAVRARPVAVVTLTGEDTAAYEQYMPVEGNAGVKVNQNLVQGSEGFGFVFPYIGCKYSSSYPFAMNTVGSSFIGYLLSEKAMQNCLAATSLGAYATSIGMITNPQQTQTIVQLSKMTFAQNTRGLTFRYGRGSTNNSFNLADSYLTAFSRPKEPLIYSSSKISTCRSSYGIQLFASTTQGEVYPTQRISSMFDVVCTDTVLDAKSFVSNTVFMNYMHTGVTVPYCTDNHVFKAHPGESDLTGSMYLSKSVCNNCDQDGWTYFNQPQTANLAWVQGCGTTPCTGLYNYMIYDLDGSFFGQKAQQIPNSAIGSAEPACMSMPAVNGYLCNQNDFAVIQFGSIASDARSRVTWPVNVSYVGGNWVNSVNANKEWQWNGAEPLNRRISQYYSLFKLFQTTIISYSSFPPSDAIYQIQMRQLPNGNPTDWTIVSIDYPSPCSVLVSVTNTSGINIFVDPFPIFLGVPQDLNNHVTQCGANNFLHETGVIQFVLNGVAGCQVRLTLSSMVKFNAHLNIKLADFYSNNGSTTFLTNLCAFLGIDPSRVKIVGLASGSVIITTTINQPQNATMANSGPYNPNNAAAADIQSFSEKLKAGLDKSVINLGSPVIDFKILVSIRDVSGVNITVCLDSFIWDSTLGKCVCPSSQVIYQQTCKECSQIPRSVGTYNAQLLSCDCTNKFVWNSEARMCDCNSGSTLNFAGDACVSCASIANTNGTAPTGFGCSCIVPYVWRTDVNQCYCPLGFYNNGTLCLPCSTVLNYNPNTIATQYQVCPCISTFQWDDNSNICVCCPTCILSNALCISCAALQFSTDLTDTLVACKCQPGFNWNAITFTCVCPNNGIPALNGISCIACGSIVHSNGQALLSGCGCLSPYLWLPANQSCSCALGSIDSSSTCVPCSTFLNTTSAQPSLPNTCSCVGNLVWDSTTRQCVCPADTLFLSNVCVSCQDMPYSNGKVAPLLDQCVCLMAFWSSTDRKCLPCGQSCLNCTALACSSCTLPFILHEGVCLNVPQRAAQVMGHYVSCVPGCSQCIYFLNNLFCVIPSEGYAVGPYGQIVQCQHCKSCIFNTPSVCLTCFTNVAQVGQNCAECTDPKCLTCIGSGTCIICVKGFTQIGGKCVTCAPNCLSCVFEGAGSCDPLACATGYVQIGQSKLCTQCFGGCQICDPLDPTICLACLSGKFKSNNTCLPCSPFCASCAINTSCSACQHEFQLYEGSCIPYLPYPCAVSYGITCLKCFIGYDLNLGACNLNLSCSAQHNCLFCPRNYYLVNSQCQLCPVIPSCIQCQGPSTACSLCAAGYFLTAGSCAQCGTGCAKCITSLFCSIPQQGYFVVFNSGSQVGNCYACDPSCATCSSLPSNCQTCYNDSIIYGNQCVSSNSVAVKLVLSAVGTPSPSLEKRLIIGSLFGIQAALLSILQLTRLSRLHLLSLTSASVKIDFKVDPAPGQTQANLSSTVQAQLDQATIPGFTIVSASVTNSPRQKPDDASMSNAVVIGVGVGMGVMIIVAGIIVYVCMNRKRADRQQEETKSNPGDTKERGIEIAPLTSEELNVAPHRREREEICAHQQH